ncbi:MULTISPECIES: hypothetical protein [Xenorhabdus]|uniref:hypothetical protein n=1 Tax=Xenorhabdus TaxID=626 RepID=UPI00064ABAB2|nr:MULTISPECIES: hypothetical protein [Xenorhabdus]KLU14381.1 hypothetical protein AAY47_16745 [Xenorhabdus griffiniae]KOP34739.1 hypothetical protein AFK69_02875 [Xenorhabdus sp. GDc328]WFQ78446.1 hypothetical protein PXH59_11940 [Xenorhabdus sp. SF857]
MGNEKKVVFFIILIVSIFTAFIGFIVHVINVELLMPYIRSEVNNVSVLPSWDVRYLAAFTSIETGFGITILYIFIKRGMPTSNSFTRGIIMWLLELAIMGRLVRQPLMDFAIGNSFLISILQNSISWINWFFICLITTFLYDYLIKLWCKNNNG